MDQKEFVNIIKNNQALINNVCRLYFSCADDVKDARQEVILQLWKSVDNFNHKSKLSTWIYRVALHTVLNLTKKNRSDNNKKEQLAQHNQIWASYAFDDDVAYLKHLIGCLKEVDRAVILLYLEGYNNKEISEVLNLTMTNVSSRLCRIKQQLRKLHTTKFYETK